MALEELQSEQGAVTSSVRFGDMLLKVKRLMDEASFPTYGSKGAACFDLYAATPAAIAVERTATVRTGLAFEVPEGHVMLVFSRSGHGYKSGVRLVNSVGVIDSDYRGEVTVGLRNEGRNTFMVNEGDRVAQAMIIPIPFVEFVAADTLSDTQRGDGGFGSTGV